MRTRASIGIITLSLCAALAQPARADFQSAVNAYRHGDFATALQHFSSERSAQAKYYLSMMLEKGDGLPQDRAKSLALLREAAEMGLDVAQADLGLLYMDGRGVARNEDEGYRWIRLAASQGLPEAMMALQTMENEAAVVLRTAEK